MRSISLLFMLGCLLTVSSLAYPTPPAKISEGRPGTAPRIIQNAITGRWTGALDTDGNHIEIALSFNEQDGVLAGSIDVVGIGGIPLEEISFDHPNLNFQFESPIGLAKFTGEKINDALSGQVKFPEAGGTFSVTRLIPADMDKIISSYLETQHIPGLAAATIRDGEVVWVGTYGMANVAQEKPVTAMTIFPLASVSKIITATALMQLHAEGKFKLNDDVNGYLPFSVRNPSFPDLPITFTQLLRHRSGVRDNPEFYMPFWSKASGDSETVLGEYLQSYLGLEGALYDPGKNFFPYQPGADFNYCNTCFALLGYLAERISGMDFQQYTQAALFKPLGIKSAAWTYQGTDKNLAASSYRYDPEKGQQDVGVVGYPDWPAGLLRMNVSDLARFLAAYTQFGLVDGKQLIERSVIELMAPKYQADGFYTWFSSSLDSTSDVLYSHGGSDLGTRTFMAFNPKTREGFLILTNGEADLQELASQIYQAMPTLGWK